jgi:hypothetical protein
MEELVDGFWAMTNAQKQQPANGPNVRNCAQRSITTKPLNVELGGFEGLKQQNGKI